MADVNIASPKGKKSSRLVAPRIDLTPMVDLGFLLITFFMLTTTLYKPKTLVINMPDPAPTNNIQVYPEESTLTLIPTSNNEIMYCQGADPSKGIHKVDDVRKLLMDETLHARQLGSNYSADAHQLHVLIKPADNSNVNNLISLLDEMKITGVKFYTIADLSEAERKLIQN